MATCWEQGVYDAILIQSSKERGVELIDLPYHISLKENMIES